MLIPFVNFIVAIILCIDTAKSSPKAQASELASLYWELFFGRSLVSAVRNIKDQRLRGRQSKGCSSSPVAKFASHSDTATGPISVCAFR
jgi:hypothetical protein